MPIDTQYFVDMSMICRDILVPANIYIYISRGGNRAGRAGPKPGRAKIGPVFSGIILIAQPVLKIGSIGPNSIFKVKKNSGGPGRAGLYRAGPNLARFFRANNLMAQPGPNFGRTGLAHRVGPILPPLYISHTFCKIT